MAKFKIEDFYNERLEQINIYLKKEYYKGQNKDKRKIASLLDEQKKLKTILGTK